MNRGNDTRLYFAYGSNLSPARLAERAITVSDATRAYVEGYRLAFNKGSERYGVAANLVPETGGRVWGALYRVTAACIEKLDRHERVHLGHYERREIVAFTENGDRHRPLTYVAASEHVVPQGRPHADYADLVLEGARHHGLPPEYIERLHTLASATLVGGR